MRHIIGGQIGYDDLSCNKFNILEKKQIISNGRSALYLILKQIKKKINIVYVPDYLCGSILQPIKEIGLKYKFYKINKDFNFKLPCKKNSAVIFLNYFGIKNAKIENIRNNIKDNIFFIKDCTHDIFSKKNNFKDFNKKNIYQFASIKKYIPFPFGAITNNDNFKLNAQNKNDNEIFKKFFKTLNNRNKYFSQTNGKIDLKIENKLLNEQNNFKKFENKKILENNLPNNIKKKLFKYDLYRILKKREKNFNFLKKNLNKKIKIVSGNECYPLFFTIILKKNEKRRIVEMLKKNRIYTVTLWPLPKQIKQRKFSYSHTLSDKLISIPLDHRYGKKDIEFMISIIHKVLKV